MGGLAAALEGVESLVSCFLFTPPPPPSPTLLLLPPPTFDFTTESDWSIHLTAEEESDWSVAFSAAAVAILALAAALGDGAGDVFDVSLRKNKLPEGRSLVSSFRVKRPSLGGVDEDEVGVVSVVEEEVGSSPVGGEWSFTNESPYFSFYVIIFMFSNKGTVNIKVHGD